MIGGRLTDNGLTMVTGGLGTETLGALVARRIAELGLPKGEIARRAGLSASYLSRILSGERTDLSARLLHGLAHALEVSPDELVTASLATPEPEADDWPLYQAMRLAAEETAPEELTEADWSAWLERTRAWYRRVGPDAHARMRERLIARGHLKVDEPEAPPETGRANNKRRLA